MTDDKNYHVDGPVPETPEPEGYPGPWLDTQVVGTELPRIDAYERMSGSAVYPSDINPPGMLYAAILRCPHPHARVVAVHTDQAEKMPGVHAVITKDTPQADIDWYYRGNAPSKIFQPHCRYEGEAVAAVAAESSHQAADALRVIRVEYEVLTFVGDERDALVAGAPAAQEGGNRNGEPDIYERGDVGQGFAEADVVLEASYRTDCEIHAPMELHGCVARWDGPRLTVWESTQGVYAVQRGVAQALGLSQANVRVIGSYMGGGFGSKLQPGKYTLIAAILARLTARPVRLFLTREETMLVVGNRPPTNMRLKAGVKKDGTLTALEMTSLSTTGAYNSGGASLVDWVVRDLYACPNVRGVNELVFVNAGPCRPFRGPGHPQGAWALEQMMDSLAEAIGMDPIDLRLKNVTDVSQARGGVPYTSTGLRECLVEGGKVFAWNAMRARNKGNGHIKRGVGVGACLWVVGGGGPPATIVVKLFPDGSANLNMGASDIGTGTKTVMAMVVGEELGVSLDNIQIEHADTGTTQFATPSGGSKTVPTESPAVRDAAVNVKRQLLEIAAEEMELPFGDLRIEGGAVVSKSDAEKRRAFAELEGFRRRGLLIGIGYRGANPEGKTVNPFAAHFCEVEVNTRTGEVKIVRFLAAHDSGRVLNRLTFTNQVRGGVVMGIGFGMTEARVLDRKQTGKMLNANLHDYKVPTALDVPFDIEVLPIELGDSECNTTGAKGVGEPATIPTAAAIANAVYDAVGIRVTETSIGPVQMKALLAEQAKEA